MRNSQNLTTALATTLAAALLSCAPLFGASTSGARATTTPKFTTLTSITGSGDAAAPGAALIKSGGDVYGTTFYGGAYGKGTIFRIDTTSGGTRVLYSFGGGTDGAQPQAQLLAAGGLLYGTTSRGGANGSGTIFSFDPAAATEKTLYSFSATEQSATGIPVTPLILSNGTIYGTTSSAAGGILFALNPSLGGVTTLYSFNSGSGNGVDSNAVTAYNGKLFGTTQCCDTPYGNGTIYALNPATKQLETLHRFDTNKSIKDGQTPLGTLLVYSGKLYGITEYGGTQGQGTVFAYDLTTGTETVLHAFTGASGDGAYPQSSLIELDGRLFGTTASGGAHNAGTVFSVDPTTGTVTTLYALTGGPDGATPTASLLEAGGQLYGTATAGGIYGQGAVFAVDPQTGAGKGLHSFTGATTNPAGGIVASPSSGRLYVTVSGGGAYGNGESFDLTTNPGAPFQVHHFTGGNDGGHPSAPVLPYNGDVYTTSATGGSHGQGTIIRISTDSGIPTVLYNFAGGTADGARPLGALIAGSDALYGTTYGGGSAGLGTVFAYNLGSSVRIVHSFKGAPSDGANPASAVFSLNGLLYATTPGGGCAGAPFTGGIVAIDPQTGAATFPAGFCTASVYQPVASLTKTGGLLFGTSMLGGFIHEGEVFRYNLHGTFKDILQFGKLGNAPYAPVGGLLSLNGQLYGATSGGGQYGAGILYSINPKTFAETTLYAFTGAADGGNPVTTLTHVGNTLVGLTSTGGAANLGTVFSFVP